MSNLTNKNASLDSPDAAAAADSTTNTVASREPKPLELPADTVKLVTRRSPAAAVSRKPTDDDGGIPADTVKLVTSRSTPAAAAASKPKPSGADDDDETPADTVKLVVTRRSKRFSAAAATSASKPTPKPKAKPLGTPAAAAPQQPSITGPSDETPAAALATRVATDPHLHWNIYAIPSRHAPTPPTYTPLPPSALPTHANGRGAFLLFLLGLDPLVTPLGGALDAASLAAHFSTTTREVLRARDDALDGVYAARGVAAQWKSQARVAGVSGLGEKWAVVAAVMIQGGVVDARLADAVARGAGFEGGWRMEDVGWANGSLGFKKV